LSTVKMMQIRLTKGSDPVNSKATKKWQQPEIFVGPLLAGLVRENRPEPLQRRYQVNFVRLPAHALADESEPPRFLATTSKQGATAAPGATERDAQISAERSRCFDRMNCLPHWIRPPSGRPKFLWPLTDYLKQGKQRHHPS